MFLIYASIAGIGTREALGLMPGFILDAFFIKRNYDASLRGAFLRR